MRIITLAFLTLLLFPMWLDAAGPILYRDATTKRVTRSLKTDIDDSGNLSLKSGGQLTSDSQALTIVAGTSQNTAIQAASGQQASITYSGGSQPGITVNDAAGSVILRVKDTVSGGGLQSSTGANRVFWSDSQAYFAFADGEVAIQTLDSNGFLVLGGWGHASATGDGGVAIQSKDATINMILVDSAGTGDVSIRPKASGDIISLADGTGGAVVTIQDTATYPMAIADDTQVNGELRVIQSIREEGDETASSTSHTIDADKSFYYYDTTSGSITSTLPTIGASVRGATFTLIYDAKTSTNTVTIQRDSTDTIDGETSVLLRNEGDVIILHCPASGTDWKKMVSGGGSEFWFEDPQLASSLDIATSQTAWTDVDLSTIVPVGTKRVFLRKTAQSSSALVGYFVRKNGSSVTNAALTQVFAHGQSGIAFAEEFSVNVDSSRIYEAQWNADWSTNETADTLAVLGYSY